MFIFLIPLFFLTSIAYSMVGLGGGSTYLALLALFSFPTVFIPKIALLCNLTVVLGGWFLFYKAGYFSLRKVLPFVITSVPMAYWGGTIQIDKTFFTLLLAISLVIAALRMFLSERAFEARSPVLWRKAWIVGIPVGSLLGFLSGLIGIGGGIYLTPILLLLGWADSQQAAAAASFFILVNSLAGLAGQFVKSGFGLVGEVMIFPLILAVFLGGQIGSRLGSQRIPRLALQRIAAGLILGVAVRLLWSLT